MSTIFFANQDKKQQEAYITLLQIIGTLSKLFSENNSPYLHYRLMENIFCKTFNATNLSRSDISADAGKNNCGIGLKTFLYNNGSSFQKIAEFNNKSSSFSNLNNEELISTISQSRNDRINFTKRIGKFDTMIYHLITRSENMMSIYEEPMDLIDINNIKITDIKETTIHFTDHIHFYNFNKSKSTLLKRFNTPNEKTIFKFKIEILNDPFEFLLSSYKKLQQHSNLDTLFSNSNKIIDYIILPLYSPRSSKVEQFSGLNQWNAKGRPRNINEAYIPIPIWIHKKKNNFFNYNTKNYKTNPFTVILPNKEKISMRVAQDNGKALMSNPNEALGKWILRDVLNIPSGELVTKETLDMLGIDSVQLSKHNNDTYFLDFLKSGSYQKFEQENNN